MRHFPITSTPADPACASPCAAVGGSTPCQRKAGTYRIIVDGEIRYLCSRHAAIEKHNREESRKAEVRF